MPLTNITGGAIIWPPAQEAPPSAAAAAPAPPDDAAAACAAWRVGDAEEKKLNERLGMRRNEDKIGERSFRLDRCLHQAPPDVGIPIRLYCRPGDRPTSSPPLRLPPPSWQARRRWPVVSGAGRHLATRICTIVAACGLDALRRSAPYASASVLPLAPCIVWLSVTLLVILHVISKGEERETRWLQRVCWLAGYGLVEGMHVSLLLVQLGREVAGRGLGLWTMCEWRSSLRRPLPRRHLCVSDIGIDSASISSFSPAHLRLDHPFRCPATTTSVTNRYRACVYAINLRVAAALPPWAAVPPPVVHLHWLLEHGEAPSSAWPHYRWSSRRYIDIGPHLCRPFGSQRHPSRRLHRRSCIDILVVRIGHL
uniref:Uncharacterized protein n=1 Tax=Oryza sativa subsp. japonica TaxID=39947 RepID=Q2QW05_ORYSJ|nr:hypothetical protein LOC_Os12g11010 [Oryza sativa Japonica Group]